MPQFNFGVGQLALIPNGLNPTPIPFAVLTDITIDVTFDLKELRGSLQFPVDVAKGNGKLTGKAKSAGILGSLLGAALPSPTTSTGAIQGVSGEPGTIPVGNQITVVNGATFTTDLGVLDFTTGKIMANVAASPAAGQYSVATGGVYSFANADQGHKVALSYAYSSASGLTTKLTNQLMGTSTPYQLVCFNKYMNNGVLKYFGLKLFSVHVPKLAWVLKAEAYTDQDIDFTAVQAVDGLDVAEFYTFE